MSDAGSTPSNIVLLNMPNDKLSFDEKSKVTAFVASTSVSESKAITELKDNRWRLDEAINSYFSKPANIPKEVNVSSIETLFNKYTDEDDRDKISGENLQRLCRDLKIESELLELAFSWKLRAKTLGEVTKTEFKNALICLRADSHDKLRSEMSKLATVVGNAQSFKEFYCYIFDYGMQPNQRVQSLDMAIGLWEVALTAKYKDLKHWCEFLRQKNQGVSRDTWNQMLDFVRIVNDDITKYDPEASWPTLIDEYVEYLSTAKA
ncbi:hypothetical protein SAMD00019534_030250 [Acytostelium subglobosum LB1]|uniref:hypothetical protein n=1 Tax=Acytostelium subglobosum LB1 TaxID=1410327 RepID=UPI0006449BDD|nr:hypothetical protein SAMD00019534_030250 [Acytostelium subglobosum LB1]GAM19850.1 hypothetical protein SAMD00019534_030250 [Acytostelium subglobosum LB1]|eukprot:XP_012756612.1 hypothetical protein SAMD00019534_030250 [Acytostelium subglobosum LB1]